MLLREEIVRSLGEVQVIAEPFSRIDLVGVQTRLAIRQRQEEPPSANHKCEQHPSRSPQSQHSLTRDAILGRHHDSLASSIFVLGRGLGLRLLQDVFVQANGIKIEDEFEEGACDEGGREVGGEVVVEEELAAHEVEGEVVGGPAEEEEAGAVVEAGAGA